MSLDLSPPVLTWRGCAEGMRRIAPLTPGVVVFAGAFGAAAVSKGMTLAEAVAMSAFVYAGVSQLVAMEIWRPEWTWGAILGLMAVTFTVNARMVLMGAAMQPWMSRHPGWVNALHLFFFTDANWLIGTRYHNEGGRDLGVVVGAGVLLWFVWVAATVPGYLLGALVTDPRRYGLDLVMPIYFAAMVVPLWRGKRMGLAWAIAGVVAVLTAKLWGGYAFIVAGALAGAIAGAFLDDSELPDGK
ncbi:MAG: AzlC family ABC transporter permease [Bosea sp. (in: a-proteobacteria)]